MSANVEDSSNVGRFDTLIWIAIAVLVVGAVAGNWYFEEWSWLYRAPTLLALAAFAVWLALFTNRGQTVWELIRESRTEMRRVVYLTFDETRNRTFFVLLVVVLLAIILWVLDIILGYSVSWVIG